MGTDEYVRNTLATTVRISGALSDSVGLSRNAPYRRVGPVTAL